MPGRWNRSGRHITLIRQGICVIYCVIYCVIVYKINSGAEQRFYCYAGITLMTSDK